MLQRFRKDRLVSFKLLPKFLPKILFQKQYITEFCYFIEIKEFIQLFKIITSSKKKKKKLKSSFKSFSSQNKRLNSRNKFSVNKMTKQTFQQEVSHNFYKIFPWMDNKPEATFPLPLSHPCLQLPDNFHIFHEIYSIDQGTWLDGPGESVNMKNKRGEKRRHLNKDSYLPLWISSHMDRIVSASFDHWRRFPYYFLASHLFHGFTPVSANFSQVISTSVRICFRWNFESEKFSCVVKNLSSLTVVEKLFNSRFDSTRKIKKFFVILA